MTLKNKKFLDLMKKEGLEKINLEKDNGYFWLWSDDDCWSSKILDLESSSILVNSFRDQSIENWVRDIKELLNI